VIEDALRSVLLADAAVSALVGTRVAPMKLPQGGTLPAIVYQRISTIPRMGMESEVGPTRSRVQLSLWADTFQQVRALTTAVRAALQGWSGPAAGVDIKLVSLANWLDDYEPGPPERFRVIADFYVMSMEGAA